MKVKQDHPDIKEKYLAEYCFSGTYIVTLLTEGYNFTSESWNDIKFIKKVGCVNTHKDVHCMNFLFLLYPQPHPSCLCVRVCRYQGVTLAGRWATC